MKSFWAARLTWHDEPTVAARIGQVSQTLDEECRYMLGATGSNFNTWQES